MLPIFSFLLSFISPLTTLLFFLYASQDALFAVLWTLPLVVLMYADWKGPGVLRVNQALLPSRYYDAALYLLALIQFLNITLMLHFVSQLAWSSWPEIVNNGVLLIVIRFLVGTSSGCSGIIVAHELIHRASKGVRVLGYGLLCSVCYGHFAIAHRQGHHRLAGMLEDITTARRGECFNAYWRRVVVAHLRYAWRYEKRRLQSANSEGKAILWRNRVLLILLIECSTVLISAVVFGWVAALMFLYQAYAAVRILEAVNYFQHWGLQDAGSQRTLGWVNDSWITQQVFVGLSQHIHHHQQAGQHFQHLQYSAEGPKMPYGYFVMNLWVKLANKSYQDMARKQLQCYKLNRLVVS